jgi:hypothetical protein
MSNIGTTDTDTDTVTAYCVHCRQIRDMKDTKLIVFKNGKNAVSGL